jgi:hypothetical protein
VLEEHNSEFHQQIQGQGDRISFLDLHALMISSDQSRCPVIKHTFQNTTTSTAKASVPNLLLQVELQEIEEGLKKEGPG